MTLRSWLAVLLLPVLLSLQSSLSACESLITTIADSRQFTLLKEAIKRSSADHQIKQMTTDMNQKCQIEETLAGNLDVFWSMTSAELEKTVLPIRILLFKAVLGNRLLILRKERQADFVAVKTKADLFALTAGQNRYWPDAAIVDANVTALVSNIHNINTEVVQAAREQSCVTEDISRSLNDLAGISGPASADSASLALSGERLFQQGERLQALVNSFRL